MDRNKIIEFIEEGPGIEDIEEIDYKPDFLVLRFFYAYDKDELDAAKDFANSQTGTDESEDVWYDEHYIPYLIDLAVDEVSDTLSELIEKMDLNVEYVNYEPERDEDVCEFIAVFTDADREFDIDEVLDSINA